VEHPFLYFVYPLELLGLDYLAHLAHEYPQVLYSWVVMAFLLIVGALGVKTLSMIPNKFQNVFETIISGIEEFMVTVTGEEGRQFFPIAATIFLYIFFCNLAGLLPGFFPPTASLNTTLSCAIVVFVTTHYIGVKFHGTHYIAHFLGPVWWMAPLIMVIEIIGHLARVLSLSFRLFGNMMGKEFILFILFMLAGAFFAPLPMMALGIFVSFIQAFIFFLLSIMYFSLAMEEAH
jgi:F-type H+-transporting ATPase subunit a